ncbi:uncharacterized protein DEA37_0006337 [Paragonimus westermani]|uniref:Uncharacterized protein n=1 Tax=Paragonimus westermani TaxID=34504 RepID=A0A5J4NS95_9TREM|nr:uncharacterized protein DEA37_0006337 [Paragonimus westermani]
MSNHRVRLRILPSTSSKNTITSKRNWAVEPINSLDYRWHLSTAIDRFLRPNCPPPCNPDVGIWELNRHDGNAIFVVWAQLSLLLEKGTGLTNRVTGKTGPTASSTEEQCPWDKINQLQSLLTFAPSVVSAEKNMGLVTGFTNNNQQIFLSPWSAPSTPFRNHLATAGLGNVEAAVVDRMGVCARLPSETGQGGITVDQQQGSNRPWMFPNGSLSEDEPRFTIYTGEGFRHKITRAENLKSKETRQLHLFDIMGQKIGSSSWIGLEEDRSTIYGIVMGNAVQPIAYRFRIAVSAEAEDGAHFSVYVTGSDPKLPSTYNHRVIMRFGADIGEQWANGHSLRDRWRLVAALDTFLRPHCVTDYLCRNSMDVLLLTFNYQAHGFTVIWAQKSLLMKTSDRDIQWQQLDTFEQRQQQQQHKKHWDRWMQEKNTWSIHRTDRRQTRFRRAPLDSCPERDLVHLERRLLGDTGFGLLPLPELAQHLKASGVGLLKEVQVERLGPCAKTLTNLPFEVPEPSGVNQRGIPVPDPFKPSQNDVVMTSYSPSEKHDRQRMLLLGILLPVCISLILLLVVILGLVWLRKRRKQKTNNQQNMDLKLATGHSATNPEAELMIRMKNKQLKIVNTVADERDNGLPNKDIPLVCKRQKSLITTVNDGLEDSCSPPTKPLILPNERPPLKPPEYNMAYTDSPVNTLPQFPTTVTPIASAFPAMSSNPGGPEGLGQGAPPKAFYGMRPNPYRNLPPPIEVKPGMPSPASQLPYAPYRKTTTLTQIPSVNR